MILIVDDRPENLFSLKSILEQQAFSVDTAESGEEALKKVLKKTYSLIILDVQMPVMNGFEVAEAISGFSRAKDTPIIFLSAVNKEKSFISRGYVSGGIDYVTKPVDPDILLLKVKTFHKLSEQKQELERIQVSLRKEIETRRYAQEKLDGHIQELQTVLESIPQVAFTIKTNGQIEYVNKQWYEYSSQISIWPSVHPDDVKVYADWEDAFHAEAEFSNELRIKNIETGEYRYYLLKILPVKQNGMITKWVGTFTDIHQQKEVNQVLEQMVNERTKELITKNEELEMRNHELQQFTWVASHDLKEPLRKIQTFNSIVMGKYLPENSEALSYLSRSIKSAERMTRLINDLLDYSRLSASNLFQQVDLNVVVSEILSDLEVTIQEKNASITTDVLPVIDAVPSQIRQVFQNLISNSLKFARKDTPSAIHIAAEIIDQKQINSPENPDGSYCRITVTDNGIGFNEEYLGIIFTLFKRLNSPDTYEGTGIGLAIAKKIVDKHNGIISARSQENEGASFIIVLPLQQVPALQNTEI